MSFEIVGIVTSRSPGDRDVTNAAIMAGRCESAGRSGAVIGTFVTSRSPGDRLVTNAPIMGRSPGVRRGGRFGDR
ncbi:hypothetical protein [Pseudonocardia phyllosphaerae]|uniref:hypothetical protein n=1 Tax=Pseudonocardia phyllosphaerae TaxID=3390502 RepID=UPI00397913A5